MNPIPSLSGVSAQHLPLSMEEEMLLAHAGHAVRDLAVGCGVLEAAFPPGTLLPEVLAAVQDRMNTADRATTEDFFGALRAWARSAPLLPADREAVDRCMVALRGHVIRRMHPHPLAQLTAFAPRLNFLRRGEGPSAGRIELDGIQAVVDAWDGQGDPIAQLRRLVLSERAAHLDSLVMHRAIRQVDHESHTRQALYFGSVLSLIARSRASLPMKLKLMGELVNRIPRLAQAQEQRRVREMCLAHLCAVAEAALGDEAVGLCLLEITLRLLRVPQGRRSAELIRGLETAAGRMGAAGFPAVAMAVRTMVAYQVIAWQEEPVGRLTALAADEDMLAFVRRRTVGFLAHPPRPDDGFEFLFEAFCLGLSLALRGEQHAPEVARLLMALLPFAQACRCLSHADPLMERLGIVWEQNVPVPFRSKSGGGECGGFLQRKRER